LLEPESERAQGDAHADPILPNCDPMAVCLGPGRDDGRRIAAGFSEKIPEMARHARLRTADRRESTQSPGVDDLPPLAEAKLAAPRQRAEMVERPRILRALDAGEGAALTLVAAPAGYGKSTAVRAWCASRPTAFAWVTLDGGDNDPVRLWTYVATAVDRVREGLGRGALQRLRVSGVPIEIGLDELMNGITAFGEELVVVLDDLQTVTDTECLASISYGLEHLPANARLIVITRSDPALRLARLRARGALAELRASELAFTTAEARGLLVDRGLAELGAREVEMLCERTEGWPAALNLAALWLRSVDDPSRAVRVFGGEHRFVADYLSQEVLGSLDDDLRSFLLRVSILGRFTAELCDGVIGSSDSASVLAELERSNLFVIRLEHGGWFRVHSLFAEFAGFQLASLEPGAAAEIHRRAAVWLRSRGLPVEAAEHAAAAGDHELLAQLLVEYHLPLIRSGGARTLLRWVRTLPDVCIVEHPELAVGAATAAVMIGQLAVERRRLLQLADRAQAERPERFGPYAQAVAAMVRAASVDGGVRRAVLDGRRAVELAEAGADDVLMAALSGYARALYFAGELDEAWAAALRAVEHPDAERRAPGHAYARSTLALVAVDRGQLASARTHAEKAKSIVGRVGSSRSWLGANASAALGAVLAKEGSLAEAERELVYAEHSFRDEVATVHHAWLLVLLARVRCGRGRLDEAAATLRSAREAIGELIDSGRVLSLATDVERELELAKARASSGEMLDRPSEAELAVLRLLATDLSTRQIGRELFLSPNTVRSHTRAIYRKLGVTSRADAVARADALGLLGQTESPM
jgi:ATP/maltotriose-dependent transcriptional regulator MalT